MELMIRQERIKRNWTQAYVGKQVGLTRTAIHDIETGKQLPSYKVLVKLEDLFGLPHRELFGAATLEIEETLGGNRANPEEDILNQE